MSGRAWAGKNTGSLTFEQLQSIGVVRGEGPGPTVAPPPLYPKMENRPLPLNMDPSMEYMLILKKQFVDFLHDSPAYVQPEAIKTDVERYSDKYKVFTTVGKDNKSKCYNWAQMPKELCPNQEIKASRSVKRKAEKSVDINTKFTKLEEIEKTTSKAEDKADDAANKNSSDEEEHDSDKEEADDPDEEMDEGTDYVDNYFDNGEGFDDEDDNIDDGPVY